MQRFKLGVGGISPDLPPLLGLSPILPLNPSHGGDHRQNSARLSTTLNNHHPTHNHQHDMKTATTIASAALLVTLCCACALAIDTEHFLHPAGLAKVLLSSHPAPSMRYSDYTWRQVTNGMSRGVVMPDELAERLQGSAESMMPSAVVPSLLCYASGQTMMLLLLGALKWAAVIDFDRVITM